MYLEALLASSLVFSSGAVLLFCAVLSSAITGMQALRATYLAICKGNVENIHNQNITGITIFFLYFLFCKDLKKSNFNPKHSVILLSLLSAESVVL